MPHPATMFFLLTLGVIFLSWIFDVYGLSVRLPHTGEEIRVQSLLSPEGIRWLLRHVVTNFTGFCPVGAGYRGDVRDRGCTTFRVYRCVYTQRHTQTGT